MSSRLPGWQRGFGKFSGLTDRRRPFSRLPSVMVGGGSTAPVFTPGSGNPVEPPWMNYRAAYIAPFGNPDYDNLTPIFNQLAGTPEYELFLSQASITQARVNNFRALWPDAYLLAYLMLYNLQWDEGNSTYGSLVQAIPDRWLRTTEGELITLSTIFGHYFWDAATVTTYLIPWLEESGSLKNWTTKYDGFFLDNLPWEMPFGSYENILSDNGGEVMVAGDSYTSADRLYELYKDSTAFGSPSFSITEQIKGNISTDLILIRNAAAYSDNGSPPTPIVLQDTNSNGCLWEPVDTNAGNRDAIFNSASASWQSPKFGIQFVSSDANYTTIQGLTWPDGQFFGQGPSLTGRL